MAVNKILFAICLGCLVLVSITTVSAFPLSSDAISPSFSNKIETMSSMNLKIASLTTEIGNRFVTGPANSGVGIFNNVQVSSYTNGIPSKGSVSALMKGTTNEGGLALLSPLGTKPVISPDTISGNLASLDGLINNEGKPQGPYQELNFFDFTSIEGEITSFSKFMSYYSAFA